MRFIRLQSPLGHRIGPLPMVSEQLMFMLTAIMVNTLMLIFGLN